MRILDLPPEAAYQLGWSDALAQQEYEEESLAFSAIGRSLETILEKVVQIAPWAITEDPRLESALAVANGRA